MVPQYQKYESTELNQKNLRQLPDRKTKRQTFCSLQKSQA